MADLSKYWQRMYAIYSAEYDQKAMLARETIAANFCGGTEEDVESLRGIIDHFATSDRMAISLIGILAQVGLCAIAMEDCKGE